MMIQNKVLFKRLLDDSQFNMLLDRFRSLGCAVENIYGRLLNPIWINLHLTDTIEVPFIAINEPRAMIDGEISLWVGIDDNDSVHSVSITDYSNPEMLAKFIKTQTKSDSVTISGFCVIAYELNNLINQLNNQ